MEDGAGISLPSLNALRVFEAAARHLSFTLAAKELHVTQTAVSHQIKLLENELGAVLFRRTPRRLALTPSGSAWAAELGPIFSRLLAVNRRLRKPARAERPLVSVSTIPSLGTRWLAPRLGRFLSRHPDIDVRISASDHLVDFAVEPIDVGIRYGKGRYPGLLSEKLSDDAFVVVCAPAVLSRRKVRSPRDLEGQTLLEDDHPHAWQEWLGRQKVRLGSYRRTVLDDSSMLLEAAVRGHGFALSRWSLSVDEVSLGRLVLPFPKIAPLPTGLSYWLAAPSESYRRPEVAAFREWLREEVASLRGEATRGR
jgi:LysR family glycine cleavage system transcriptional activator